MKTSKTMYSLLIVLSLIFIAVACTETPVNEGNKPKVLTMTILEDTVSFGYKWFLPNYRDYIPDAAIVTQIRDAFAANPCKFYIYVKTSCKCTGTEIYFPSIVKTLITAGIDTTNFEIYDSSFPNPYPEITLNVNPSCFIVRNLIPIYSITDTLDAYQSKNYKVEEVILMGMKK